MSPKRVLSLRTGNSCRSQMAEGILRHLVGSAVDVASAGTVPKGVQSLAMQVMRELDIDLSHHGSKGIDRVAGRPWARA